MSIVTGKRPPKKHEKAVGHATHFPSTWIDGRIACEKRCKYLSWGITPRLEIFIQINHLYFYWNQTTKKHWNKWRIFSDYYDTKQYCHRQRYKLVKLRPIGCLQLSERIISPKALKLFSNTNRTYSTCR